MADTPQSAARSRFAQNAFKGGIPVGQALKAADFEARAVRGRMAAALIAGIERLNTLASDATLEPQGLYRASAEIIDLGACDPTSGVSDAARSLCDLVERAGSGGGIDRRSVRVHLDALRLFSQEPKISDEHRQGVLAGLRTLSSDRRVVGRDVIE